MASMLSPKALLISTSVVFVGLALKLCAPLVMELSASHMPLMWASLLSWLKPPYLYVIINCIIISIAASSRFHHQSSKPDRPYDPTSRSDAPAEISPDFGVLDSTVEYEQREETVDSLLEVAEALVVNGSPEDDEKEEYFVSPQLKIMDSLEIQSEDLFPVEKPLVSTRFGHRKPVKASTEGGRALRVAKPKRHETLENTWKAITERRAVPLTRHVRKCETWENHGRTINVDALDGSQMKKAETFKDRTNQTTSSPGGPTATRLLREPSLSQDELNRRVEAFIRKFNEEMRLQRQESLNKYMEMINRGSH